MANILSKWMVIHCCIIRCLTIASLCCFVLLQAATRSMSVCSSTCQAVSVTQTQPRDARTWQQMTAEHTQRAATGSSCKPFFARWQRPSLLDLMMFRLVLLLLATMRECSGIWTREQTILIVIVNLFLGQTHLCISVVFAVTENENVSISCHCKLHRLVHSSIRILHENAYKYSASYIDTRQTRKLI